MDASGSTDKSYPAIPADNVQRKLVVARADDDGHDFEETFTLLEGELEFTFRGAKQVARAGTTVHVPANAPHQFHNASGQPARMLCLCAPAGQEELFRELGVAVATRTTPPPALDEAAQMEFKKKAAALAPKYRTEFVAHW
jgi:oxalate decarboxylase/phosphoglucose isomerase-like protein (cupin superfamily)